MRARREDEAGDGGYETSTYLSVRTSLSISSSDMADDMTPGNDARPRRRGVCASSSSKHLIKFRLA